MINGCKERQEIEARGLNLDEEGEEYFLMRRLDAGLFTLQLVDYVIACICTTNHQAHAVLDCPDRLNTLDPSEGAAASDAARQLVHRRGRHSQRCALRDLVRSW